jgi:hypothetical protein
VKTWLEWLYFETLLYWDHYFGHWHKYTPSGTALYSGEDRGTVGIPVVAWIYRCKCGKEIVELDTAGIRLLQQGVEYDKLIEERI